VQRFSKFIIAAFLIADLFLLIYILIGGNTVALFNPQGEIALRQRDLITFSMGLMLAVAIPVFLTAIFVAYKYRASNKNQIYSPDWDQNNILLFTRWLIPCTVVLILTFVVWNTSHSLDPHMPISSTNKPITIQVVALNWKWLFIYPEQNIASVNFMQFPVNTPINFELTADPLMNSFWIPQLGGQMYAMAGMINQHHLIATSIGEFTGAANEINGKGYSDMRFIAKSTSESDFNLWVQKVKESDEYLNINSYNKLAKQKVDTTQKFYSSVEPNLYTTIVTKYTAPGGSRMIHESDEKH